MEAKIVKGSVAGFPISGRVVNYSSADITQIVAAASGLGRILLTGGAVAAGAFALLGVLASSTIESQKSLEELSKSLGRKLPRIPIAASIAVVLTQQRFFQGIVLDDNIEFDCEGNRISASLDVVNSIWRDNRGWSADRLVVETVDGSVYRTPLHMANLTPKIRVATTVGIQTIEAPGDILGIRAATIDDAKRLRDNLQNALSCNLQAIVQVVGQQTFDRFFDASQFQTKLQTTP